MPGPPGVNNPFFFLDDGWSNRGQAGRFYDDSSSDSSENTTLENLEDLRDDLRREERRHAKNAKRAKRAQKDARSKERREEKKAEKARRKEEDLRKAARVVHDRERGERKKQKDRKRRRSRGRERSRSRGRNGRRRSRTPVVVVQQPVFYQQKPTYTPERAAGAAFYAAHDETENLMANLNLNGGMRQPRREMGVSTGFVKEVVNHVYDTGMLGERRGARQEAADNAYTYTARERERERSRQRRRQRQLEDEALERERQRRVDAAVREQLQADAEARQRARKKEERLQLYNPRIPRGRPQREEPDWKGCGRDGCIEWVRQSPECYTPVLNYSCWCRRYGRSLVRD